MSSHVSKLVNIILIIMFAAPILYGLYLVDFDIQRFLQLDFETIRIEAEFRLEDMIIEDSKMLLVVKALNTGNREFSLKVINATVNISSVEPTGAELRLSQDVFLDMDLGTLEAGKSLSFKIPVELGIPASQFAKGRYDVNIVLYMEVEYQGEVFVRRVEFTGYISVS